MFLIIALVLRTCMSLYLYGFVVPSIVCLVWQYIKNVEIVVVLPLD